MRVGEKCVFTLDSTYFGGKLKPRHRYKGSYAGVYRDDDWVVYRGAKLRAKTVEPIKKPTVKKEKAPTASDYKNCSDMLFEIGVRYRDDWRSIISGKQFEEYDWNGLQAGHGCSRQYWDTRHAPKNCHAITSGENYAMSIGNSQIIMKYWEYVAKTYGEFYAKTLINMKHEPMKLNIGYLKEDCIFCYNFFYVWLVVWSEKYNKKRDPDEVIKKRCEKFTKAKTDGIMKVLKIVKGEL